LLHKRCKRWPILRLEKGFRHGCGTLVDLAMAMQLPQKRAADSPAIPDRLYFKIGDVARICAVETYVLRFWETQFPQLKPGKSGTGQRLYRRRDVELALKIKNLVHTEGYTISGARQVLEQGQRRPDPKPAPAPKLPLLQSVASPREEGIASAVAQARSELRKIAGLLASPDPNPPRRRARLATMPPAPDSLFPS